MYTEQTLHHFRHPRNIGDLPPPAKTVNVENPACGDTLRLSVLWQDGVVKRAAYRVRGCTASIAAGSVLTEWLRGKSAADLASLTTADIDEALGGLPPESLHAAALCCDAVTLLLRDNR